MDIAFILLLLAWALAAGSPGPATIAIAGTSMNHGRGAGLALAFGVVCGSATWGLAAAFGMSALMMAHSWLIEVLRYAGAMYLIYLAFKAGKSALKSSAMAMTDPRARSLRGHYVKGLLIHLTNPKAIFGWGALFAIVVPPGSQILVVAQTFAILLAVSATVFLGYGVLFSTKRAIAVYQSLHRWIEGVFAALFAFAGFKILTARFSE